MEDYVKKDILDVIKDSLIAVSNNNIKKLSEISNHTIHDATLIQDPNTISIAVITYSLSKVYEKNQYQQYKDWHKFHTNIILLLKKARKNLQSNNIYVYKQDIKQILASISRLEKKFSIFITHVINQARIKKGSKIYEHGISIGRTAKLLNITPWDLMTYIGATKITDIDPLITKPVKERLEIARNLFI